MAKREITATSSPVEVRTAYEQLAKAQQEYRQALDALRNEQGIPVVPSTGKPLTAQQEINLASNVAAKYDYVRVGGDLGSAETGYNVGGDTFSVKGLENRSKTVLQPESKTTINTDDSYPVTKPQEQVLPNYNNSNPNERKIDQSIANEQSPSTVTESSSVQSITENNTSSSAYVNQSNTALNQREKNRADASQGVVNQNLNELPTSNNTLPGRLSDEFVTEPSIADNKKTGNKDDLPRTNRPMGTAITGFTNIDALSAAPDPGTVNASGITIGTTDSVLIADKTGATPNNPKVPIRSNILHNYVNWTYKIGLYLLKFPDYNTIIEGAQIPDNAKQYPIAISGGYRRSGSENNFERDFYIENLRFTSVIGNRLTSTATNNFNIEMTIVEPYSASFIGELATLAGSVNGVNNTISENPYLLEIDFTGYKDDGTMVPSILSETQSKQKKYIPVKIIGIEMKLDAGGARYTLNMTPYGFYAFTQKRTALTKDAWVYGETVDEILGDNSLGLIGRLNQIEEEKKTKDQKQDHADVYKIQFYSFDKVGSSTKELQQSKVAFPTEGGPATIIKNRKIDENKPTKQGYTIKAGTILKEVIKDLVLASEYFNTKMNPDANKNKDNSKPAELVKVIPQIKILTDKWDGKRNEYAKEITFHVFNTLLFGENFPNGGLATIRDWGYSKEYNYIFTGKNVDIINLDVNFNLLYYTKFFTDKNELGLILTDMVADRSSNAGTGDSNQFSATSAISGMIGKTVPNEPSRYINASLVAEFMDLKMNNSYGDMIEVDMDIIGDPDWIPQDSSIRGGPIKVANFNSKLDSFESISIDVAGVYAKIQLRTPRDYNDKNGLMDLNKDSSFVGGVYQVITVDNIFENGKYTCKLNMIKIPNQEENQKSNANTTRTNVAREVNETTSPVTNNPAVNTNATASDIPNGTRA